MSVRKHYSYGSLRIEDSCIKARVSHGDVFVADIFHEDRVAAAQALAGDEYRVVPAKDEPVDADVMIADLRAILDALGLGDHSRPHPPHEVVQREVLPEIRRLRDEIGRLRDRNQQLYSEATYPYADGDTLVLGPETFTDWPDQTIICHKGENYVRQPDRPEPVDPASVRTGQVVDYERKAGYKPLRIVGEVENTIGDNSIQIAGKWWNTSPDMATVRVLQRAEPEPDPDAVEAMEVALANVGIYAPHDAALRLIRDHGVHVEVPDA